MSERIEKLMRDYPQMKTEARCLENQIRDFRGISETEMIESMQFSQPESERVQTSGVSDKTARIAISYRERMERINGEWYDYLEKKYVLLSEELRFFESAVRSLKGELGAMTEDLVFSGMTWDSVESKYNIGRTTVCRYRKKAIAELDRLYAAHDAEVAAYILK
jgi:DNA-directed RNA polymerase specialized sigma subunit